MGPRIKSVYVKLHFRTYIVGTCIDDSNQGVAVEDCDVIEDVAIKLKAIADSVLPGIIMEVDLPSNYSSGKLPILDMQCYMQQGQVMHEHYAKPMATRLVISARSAHSEQTKRSVHISECVRRMVNTSPDLSWDQHIVPHLTEYCRRMMAAGYSQTYRKEIIRNAVNIYDGKLQDDEDGVQPLYRPRGYRKVERRKEKRKKKQSWATRGGYTAPIMIPATPGGVLAERLRAVAERRSIPGLRFRIQERGGVTVMRQLQKSNPTTSSPCGRPDCGPCAQPGGNGGAKLCHKTGIVYQYNCQYDNCDAEYRGESSKNLYTRNLKHQSLYTSKSKKSNDKSFMYQHQHTKHNAEPADFQMKVLASYADPLSRQASEAIHISKMNCEILNGKSEFHQPSIVDVKRSIRWGL